MVMEILLWLVVGALLAGGLGLVGVVVWFVLAYRRHRRTYFDRLL